MTTTRTFTDSLAVRERVPLLLGLVGPSGCGKTLSALLLAAGIQRVSGGDIFLADSESRRALAYSDRVKFRHVPFGAPFSPLDYLAVIEHCVARGAGTVVIDSASHEHEGSGGVLEMHTAEHARLGNKESTKMLAWSKPKQARRRLINTILQMPVNFVFTWRAKEAIKPAPKGAANRDPIEMGFKAISGDEWLYEQTVCALLLPGAEGVPIWQSGYPGEKAAIKLPGHLRSIFVDGDGRPLQLSADIGEKLARWAAGGEAPAEVSADALLAQYVACSDPATFRALEGTRKAAWPALPAADKARIKSASDDAKGRIATPVIEPERDPDTGEIIGGLAGAATQSA